MTSTRKKIGGDGSSRSRSRNRSRSRSRSRTSSRNRSRSTTRNNIPSHAIDPEAWSQEMGDNPDPAVILGPDYVLPVDVITPLPNYIENDEELNLYFMRRTILKIAEEFSIYDATEVRALLDELEPVWADLAANIQQITATKMKDNNFKRELHIKKMAFFRMLLDRFRILNQHIWREIIRIRDFVNIYIIERTKRCNRVPTHFRFISRR